MKQVKKLSVLLLALVLVLSLAACGKSEAKALEGSWTGKVDTTEALTQMIKQSGLDVDEIPGMKDLKLEFTLKLDFDGENYTMDLDKKATQKSMEKFLSEMKDLFKEFLYQMAEGQNMSREDLDSSIMQSTNMTMDEYMDTAVEEIKKNADPTGLDLEESGLFTAKDGRIYFGEDKEELESEKNSVKYTLKGDTLTLDDLEGNALGLKGSENLLPLEFER